MNPPPTPLLTYGLILIYQFFFPPKSEFRKCGWDTSTATAATAANYASQITSQFQNQSPTSKANVDVSSAASAAAAGE